MSSFLKQIGNIIFPSLKTDLPVHPHHSIVFSQGRKRILTVLLRASVDMLSGAPPALIILDLHLPFLSGKDLLYYIRADQRFTQTRIMLTTADTVLAENLREEADLVLLKPISPGQLRDLAKRLRPPDMEGD